MAGLNVAHSAADFSNVFWPPVGLQSGCLPAFLAWNWGTDFALILIALLQPFRWMIDFRRREITDMATEVSNREMSEIIADSVRSGVFAAATTTAAAAICGQLEDRQPIGPINAVSHILWGDRAARQTKFSLKHTLSGAVLNAAAVSSWAFLQEVVFGRKQRRATIGEAVTEGAAISALAYVTDYYLVPDRLTPGFEKRLSNKSLTVIYGVLALSLGVGALTRRFRS